MKRNLKLLDCTMRDGGQGLEAAYLDQMPHNTFNKAEVTELCDIFSHSNIDIIELGSIDRVEEDKKPFCTFYDIESMSANIPKAHTGGQMYIGLFRGPDTPIDAIPDFRPGLIEGIRVIIRYSEMEKSMEFCAALCKKGYKVFVQPMVTMRYTKEQLDYVIDMTNKMHAFALYFVDSYGYMMDDDVEYYYNYFNERLDPDICIGFHAHNNMDMAVSNAITFIKMADEDRKIIVDSTALGMGQGAGNLQTEVIANYLNKKLDRKYDMSSILRACEIIEKHNINDLWGYSLTKYIPTLSKAAYKYAVELRSSYGMSVSEIEGVLREIPDDLRHRHTKENTKELLRRYRLHEGE